MTAEQFRAAITDKTVALILNSPSNPTGAVYNFQELEAIAAVAVEKNVIAVSDEIYEKLIYEGEHVSIASLNPQIKDLTIIINGVSKTFAMTGWRIGYAVGDAKVIKTISGFGAPEYFRLSYATSFEKIEKGLSRIAKFVEN